MPEYRVVLHGSAWCRLDVLVSAEDELEAERKAAEVGKWQIVGDIDHVGADIQAQSSEPGK